MRQKRISVIGEERRLGCTIRLERAAIVHFDDVGLIFRRRGEAEIHRRGHVASEMTRQEAA